MINLIKLSVRFTDEEIASLQSLPSTESAKKLLWLYIKMPEFVQKIAPFEPSTQSKNQEGQTYYLQFSSAEECQALEKFSGKRAVFIKHLFLNEKKIFDDLVQRVNQNEVPIRINDQVEKKLDQLKETILSGNKDINSLLKKMLVKQEVSLPVTEMIQSNKPLEKAKESQIGSLKEKRQNMPPISTSKFC